MMDYIYKSADELLAIAARKNVGYTFIEKAKKMDDDVEKRAALLDLILYMTFDRVY